MSERTCRRCGVVKPVAEFSRCAGNTDGIKGSCKACDSEYNRTWWSTRIEQRDAHNRAYKAAHRERLREYDRARYYANLEYFASKTRGYRINNPDYFRERARQWQREHPDRVRAGLARRRALRAGAAGDATAEQMLARVAYFGGRCWMCGAPWEAIDHVKPLARGGSNWPANLRPACRRCNTSKKDRWPVSCASVIAGAGSIGG